jgi:FkbM family methyltransferase
MSRWWDTPRFDALEFILVSLLIGVVLAASGTGYLWSQYARTSYFAYSAAQETERLKARYGPNRHSRFAEEWIIRDYFQDRRDGSFVDVGANHYSIDSNTFYLETTLGWTGIAIEPQAEFAAGYRKFRPRTRFFSFFVSDTSDATITFYRAGDTPLASSANRSFAERGGTDIKNPVYTTQAVKVPTIRLTDLLDRAGISRFDFLSVDVELAEPKVLAGFDVDRFKPSLVCIEAHPQVRQKILDYFARHGYVLLGRYLRADLQNLYFEPIGLADPPL